LSFLSGTHWGSGRGVGLGATTSLFLHCHTPGHLFFLQSKLQIFLSLHSRQAHKSLPGKSAVAGAGDLAIHFSQPWPLPLSFVTS
jgi:hypothetical protein